MDDANEVKISNLHWNFFAHLKHGLCKFFEFSKFLAKNWIFQSFTALFVVGSFVCFLVVIWSTFNYTFPFYQTPVNDIGNTSRNSIKTSDNMSEECNLFDGRWIVDENYPLYNASQCPFIETGFDCLGNGRKDKEYLKWRWKPRNCEIPRFDVRRILEMLRGKRVVFVGDSLSRTQCESMICMLMSGVEDTNSVYEVNGNNITKQSRHRAFRFRSFDISVEFYRCVFLVQMEAPSRRSPKKVKMALKLDQMDGISREWIDSDILVFNSGHWWKPKKLLKLGWYFQIGGRMKLGLPINIAFRTALATWQSWIETSLNPNRTQVFFRTFESNHWGSGTRQNCNVTTQPSFTPNGRESSLISETIIKLVKNVAFPVKLLHVTLMGAFRSDAHVGSWSDNSSVSDCNHWCLPGVPDTWNEILFSILLSQ